MDEDRGGGSCGSGPRTAPRRSAPPVPRPPRCRTPGLWPTRRRTRPRCWSRTSASTSPTAPGGKMTATFPGATSDRLVLSRLPGRLHQPVCGRGDDNRVPAQRPYRGGRPQVRSDLGQHRRRQAHDLLRCPVVDRQLEGPVGNLRSGQGTYGGPAAWPTRGVSPGRGRRPGSSTRSGSDGRACAIAWGSGPGLRRR